VKIESIRFRSVAFRDPTSATAMSSASTPSTSAATPSTGYPNSIPVPNHSAARASTWRKTDGDEKEKQVAAEAEAEGDAKKAYLTPAQKKKILFIQGAFHPEAKSVSAYVVLAHQAPCAQQGDGDAEEKEGEEEGKDDTPYAAAACLARAANASEFMGRVLRVDVCARLPLADAGAGAGAAGAGAGANEDPKLSIFLGNLDFASTESDVREFFEGVVASERGPAPADDGSGRWVQTVRLIRDRETQLGKGFGYISFVVGILFPSPHSAL
jgi:nucleolar protein 12